MGPNERQIIEHLDSIVTAVAESSDTQGAGAIWALTRARAAIDRYAPPESAYVDQARKMLDHNSSSDSWKAQQLVAIVAALRDDYKFGAMQTVAELLHADLFDDFLASAQELLGKGYVVPAAVVAGTVLEEHIHKLTDKAGIPRADSNNRPKSFETLSVDLRKESVVSEVQRKTLAAWYAQRNAAAHGEGDKLVDVEVERMIDGVRDFIARHPA